MGMDQLLNKEERLPAFKLTIVQYVIVAILLVLLSGLWRLQVVGAQNYRTLAEQNRIRKVPILAPRGKLFDRDGRLLVDNYPSVSCFLIRELGRDIRADLLDAIAHAELERRTHRLAVNDTPTARLIDVREEYEFDEANLNGTLIPMGEVMDRADEIPKDKQVVVHCRSGKRSATVISALESQLGYTNLYNLKGGILAYAEEVGL